MIVLHIGLPRTATTFLQQDVFRKIEGINFIDGSQLKEKNLDPIFKTIIKSKNKKANLLYKYLDPRNDKVNLVSCEGFYGDYFNKEFNPTQNMTNLHDCFPTARIIFCKRDYESFIKSFYNLYIRLGGTKNYEDFLEHHIDKKNFQYKDFIQHLYNLFGKNNVLIYDFKDFTKDSENVIKKICDFIGVNVPKYDSKKRMVSLSRRQLKLVQCFNHLFRTRFNRHGIIPWKFNITPPRLIIEKYNKWRKAE